MIDCQIPKTAGLAGLEGLPSLLLQHAEGLADFEGTLVSSSSFLSKKSLLFAKLCKRGEFSRIAMVIKLDQVLLPSTGLIFAFFN